MARRLLVTWIGHTDFRAMKAAQPEHPSSALVKHGQPMPNDGVGPIKALLDKEYFDEVHLISNDRLDLVKAYAVWSGVSPRIHSVELKDPTDYASVYEIADSVLQTVTAGKNAQNTKVCIHLSPGTPSMTAIWVLLGKSKYPACFYQTFKNEVRMTEIPFDLAVDYLPKALRQPDQQLQAIVAGDTGKVSGFEDILGRSVEIRSAIDRARRAALRDIPVLLLGESGTGKEMFARAIHQASPRRAEPFLAINCAAMPKELLESELFGHKKGSFTGAFEDKEGAFRTADKGALFLDEIGECDQGMQAKLLRVLQPPSGKGPSCRVFRRVGDSKDQTSDVRIIAATNRDLDEDVRQNRFRSDLFYRLAVISIRLPPLRHRKGDIGMLAKHLLDQINKMLASQPGYEHKMLSASATSFVLQHPWPGNVRELYNALLQAAALGDGTVLNRAELAVGVCTPTTPASEVPELGGDFSLEHYLDEIQRGLLRKAMNEAEGVKTHAARLLGIKNYQTLDAQLKRLKVDWSKSP